MVKLVFGRIKGIYRRFMRKRKKLSKMKEHQILIEPNIGMCVQDQNILHERLPPKK